MYHDRNANWNKKGSGCSVARIRDLHGHLGTKSQRILVSGGTLTLLWREGAGCVRSPRCYPVRMNPIDLAFARELERATQAEASGDRDRAWAHLERTHILGQARLGSHLRAHARMLRLAWAGRDPAEVAGQALRLAFTFLGHLTGRLPTGNTGRSNVSMFKPMELPEDLKALLSDRRPK